MKKSLLKKNNKEQNSFGKSMLEQIPIRYYEEDFFVLYDSTILNIFEVQGKSFYNASKEELETKVYRFAEYYRVQKEDIKFIFMNYPTNTTKQQGFLSKKLKENTNPHYTKWLQKELGILKDLESYRTDRVAFIFIFAKNENAYHRQVDLLKQKSTLNVLDVTYEKKLTVLRKLNNQNKSIKV
jgi:hypothetical protein